jgi:hypothetical protein
MLPTGTAQTFIERALRRKSRQEVARCRGVLPQVLRLFVAEPGPVPRAALVRALPGLAAARLDHELARLDAQDQILLEDGAVTLAYPFAGLPNAFRVRLAGGAERYACCAIDALGIAPMLGQRIDVESRCHHSGAALAFGVAADGPEREAAGVMAWVGERRPGDRRVCLTL